MRKHVALNRLKKLLEVVKKIPPKQFDMSYWAKKTPECDTVACVAGWAGLDPWFRKAGFKTLFNSFGDGYLAYDEPEAFFGGSKGTSRVYNIFYEGMYSLKGAEGKREKIKKIKGIIRDIEKSKYTPELCQ